MSTVPSHRPVPLGAITTHRIVAGIDHWIAAARAWRQARGTETALMRLSDRELRDIGVTRAGIPAVAERAARG